MNRRLFGALGVVVVFTLSVGSCKSDPFADVHGTPAGLVTNFSYLQVAAGDSTPLRASVVDATATPLELPVTFTACTADVSVLTDTSYHAIPNTSTQVLVKGVNPSPSCVVAAGGGFKDTIKVAVAKHAKPEDLVQPGHIFPLRAVKGGVLMRAGHTEAGCDLGALAGLTPAAVICEIMKDDGTMARLPDLIEFAQEHGLKVVLRKIGIAHYCADPHSFGIGKFFDLCERESVDVDSSLARHFHSPLYCRGRRGYGRPRCAIVRRDVWADASRARAQSISRPLIRGR